MAMTGFNPSQVSNSINQVKNAYRAYMDAMNTAIINLLSTVYIML